jgi:hypothetical protein
MGGVAKWKTAGPAINMSGIWPVGRTADGRERSQMAGSCHRSGQLKVG